MDMDLPRHPLGVTQLIALDSVRVIRRSNVLETNKYELVAPDDTIIMFAEEEISELKNFLSSNSRTFNISIRDTENVEVIRLRRPSPWFVVSKMKVTLCGQLVGVVRNKVTWRHPVLVVNDAADKPVLKLQGKKKFCSMERAFRVLSGTEEQVGEIVYSVTRGAGREARACAELSFPAELDVRHKAALVGASMLVDYLDL